MKFVPNMTCRIRKAGTVNLYGEKSLGREVTEPCAIVQLRRTSGQARANDDQMASRGHAEEILLDTMVLLTPATVVAIDDRLTVAGFDMRVKSIFPRFDVTGTLHHYEVTGAVWR